MRETPDPTPAPAPPQRLRRIEIRNYKALDALDLDFPAPLMTGDPDITVVGSANGVGKTSLLECCALAHLNMTDPVLLEAMLEGAGLEDEWRHHIRANQPRATIVGYHTKENVGGQVLLQRDDQHDVALPATNEDDDEDYQISTDPLLSAQALLGRSANPMLLPELLFFHSSRKILEGSIPAAKLLNGGGEHISVFKRVILSAMMGRAGLIEDVSASDAAERYEKLDELLAVFAGYRLAKLRGVEGDFELRVASPQGLNFTFDGLSSGQKEIVSTLFLIWHSTRARPALVLIDEPELHLNAEWHRDFVLQLHKLAPHNQYILATHSAHIFGSVDRDRRIMLGPQV